LVIFGIGINDAHEKSFDTVLFKNNYLALCDSIRKVNPKCAFIFVTNNDSYRKTGRKRYAVNTNGPLARDVFYRLAALTDGAVWDQFEIMGGLKSMEKWQKPASHSATRCISPVRAIVLWATFSSRLFFAKCKKPTPPLRPLVPVPPHHIHPSIANPF
jgi:hypothetical protein